MGDHGATGPQGVTGKGSTGPQGETGPMGDHGHDGETGPQGSSANQKQRIFLNSGGDVGGDGVTYYLTTGGARSHVNDAQYPISDDESATVLNFYVHQTGGTGLDGTSVNTYTIMRNGSSTGISGTVVSLGNFVSVQSNYHFNQRDKIALRLETQNSTNRTVCAVITLQYN